MSLAVNHEDLREIFSADRAAEILRTRIPECRDTLDLHSAELLDIRYQPGIECAVAYNLRFTRRVDNSYCSHPLVIYLPKSGQEPRAVPPETARRYAELENRVLADHTIPLPEFGAIAHPYPIDMRLPGLIDASDRQFMKAALGPFYRRRGLSVRSVKPKLLSYTLGSRATLSYRVKLVRRGSSTEFVENLVGKLSATSPLAELMSNNWTMWRESEALFHQARPVGVIQSIGLSLQVHVEGARLNAHVEDPSLPDLLRQVGEAAAHLHGLRLPLSRTRTAAREITALRRRFALLSELHPDPKRIATLEKRLLEAVDRNLIVLVPVHGDFHHANVLVANGAAHLIDFDEMGMGDPMLDVARFLVSLSLPSLRVFGDLRLCEVARGAFLTSYARGAVVEPMRLAMFESLAYVTSAASIFRLQRKGWEIDMETLISRAETRLNESAAITRRSSGVPVSASCDRRKWVSDPTYIEFLLKADAYRSHGAEVEMVKVVGIRGDRDDLRADYRVHFRRGGEVKSADISALAGDRVQALALRHALEIVADALAGSSEGFVLPTPMGQSPALSLLLFARPEGRRLVTLLDDEPELVESLARDLAALHALDVDIPRTRTLSGVIASAMKLALGEANARAEVNDVALRLKHMPDLRRISLAGADLRHFTARDGRIGLLRPDALAMAHPLIAAGRLAADLAACDPEAAERFRNCYSAASGAAPDEMAPFEALAHFVRGATERQERYKK